MISPSQLLATFSRYWGYDAFRPGQEEIALSIAEGRDACVVMPTGGGKSLCYQLPAVLANKSTAIVVSPLIALMQDQVSQLEELGIPAAVLNSSLALQQREKIYREVARGAFRLLYLSPESITQESIIRWLKSLDLSFFVIDEAHCISEWGHDFRPEYRQLNRLRREFPKLPIAAFTASATQRVRHDIVEQLDLRDPHKHVASFYRRNLRYFIRECAYAEQEAILLESLRALENDSAIVYAPTIRRVEEVLEFLKSNDIPAVGYHGKMEASERAQNQKRWSSNEVRVLVGTVAFGLGINKSNVRKVIHLSLPKSVEQYYQEAGRAGRDALPADCLLLWQKRDVGFITHFISEIADQQEREHAWQRYRQVREFVDSSVCRQFALCRHFGERTKWESCGNCDVCSGLPEWFSRAARTVASSRSNSGPLSLQAKESLQLLSDGLSLAEIARKRGRSLQSVENLVGAMVERGQCAYRPEWVAARKYELIRKAGARIGWDRLKPIKEQLPKEITYGEIRLVAAHQRLQALG